MVTGHDQDPLGIGQLLQQSAAALRNATTPAEGVKALADALDSARAQQDTDQATRHALLERWAEMLRTFAPLLPDMAITDMPILGPYPQRQQQLRDLIESGARYQAATDQQMTSAFALINDCLTAFQARVEADEAAEADLTMQWISIAEPRYEAWLDDATTQANLAELINAWSALSKTLRAITDELLEALGMPSSRGLEDIAKELHRLRQQHREQINALREEINALKTAMKAQSDD